MDGFVVESDIIVIGDPMPGETSKGTYIEIATPFKGNWRHIGVFNCGQLEYMMLGPKGEKYKIKDEEYFTITSNSGYIGVFDDEYFINDGTDEEYEDTIVEDCAAKSFCYMPGGSVSVSSSGPSKDYSVCVRRGYSGEVMEITIDLREI